MKVPSSVIDPRQWKLPNPRRVIATFQALRTDKVSRRRKSSAWVFSSAIPPVDLYAYLKWRFGPPNGFAMTLRSSSVDNLIHWNYTLECPQTTLDLTGLSMRTEIRAYSAKLTTTDWKTLESNLLTELNVNSETIGRTKNTFEHWHLFLNPFRRLSAIAERLEKRLRDIEIPQVESPHIPTTNEEVERFARDMAAAIELYQEAMTVCISLEMIVPVMGEASVNFLMMLLAKPEIRKDERMRQDFSRRPIDVRVKSLHIICDGFSQPVTGTELPFKNFLRIMKRRNDALHGNIDPRKTTGEEIFFDLRTIPLLPAQRSFGELALASALANLSPQAVLDDVNTARTFVQFLLSRLVPEVRAVITRAMEELLLGYRRGFGTIGVILPSPQVDFFPALGSPPKNQAKSRRRSRLRP